MIISCIDGEFCVCQPVDISAVDFDREFCFFAKTDEELSLVCKAEDAPERCIACEDGWSGFRISGVLDFSLVGILSEISSILAASGISIFAVSTYNTDYIFVKSQSFEKAIEVLADNGYEIE